MSSKSRDRAVMLDALNREVRWFSAHSVLFSQLLAERAGLSPTDLESLDILELTGPIPAGRLARLIGLTTGSVTNLIDRLEAAGCVRREQDPSDRRKVIVRPLPMPERLARSVEPATALMARGFEEVCARYSDEELALILDFAEGANAAATTTIAQVREGSTAKKSRRPARDFAEVTRGSAS